MRLEMEVAAAADILIHYYVKKNQKANRKTFLAETVICLGQFAYGRENERCL